MKLASIEKIHSIVPHPGPEVTRIECAKVKGWPVVVPKGQYKDGEHIVFICIDSVVPKDNPVFSFMEKQKYRVWNARFKGAASSGLVQPLSILPFGEYKEGDDVSTVLNIIKYEKPIDPLTNGDAKGGFPTHLISISDEDNLLSYPEVLDELQEGEVLNVTTKSDGSSTTFSFEADGTFRACSRRQELKEGTGFPWKIEKKYNLQAKMRGLGYPLVIQGEAVGPGLNGNRLELKEPEFHLFRAKDLVNYNQLSNFELKELAEVLGVPVVKSVMVIHFIKNVHTVEFFRNLADSILYDNGKPGEGIVISPETPKHSHVLNKNWSVKVINNYYKQ